jgi:integrase
LAIILQTADARCPDCSEFFKELGWTGLRLGEACELQLGDLDAVGGFRTIYRTAQYRKADGMVTLLLGYVQER